MSADPVDWRLEQYGKMGFDNMQSLILSNTRDAQGIPLYWVEVKELVAKIGLVAAYDILAA